MPQLYAQVASRPDPWLLGRTSAGLCTLQTACPLTITYSGGSPAADTIAAGSAATVYGGSAATFDASADVWVVLTVAGSSALQVTREADLAAVTGDWAGLARIVQHAVEPYQPQAYLAAGGVGGGPARTTTVVSDTTARVLDLWTGSSNAAQPSGWHDEVFDDSAWTPGVVYPVAGGAEGPLAGTDAINESTGPTWHDGADFLFRQTFLLPAGLITAATFTFRANDLQEGAWLNGASLGSELTPSGGVDLGPDLVATPAPSVLHAGASNTIAVWVRNGAPGGAASPAWASYSLVVTYASGGAGGAVEGDLLYFHSGVWADLPIGTTGQELTVVGGDPAWTDQPADSDYSDPLTTKGDLLTRTSSATVRLGVGSNGQVVTADSTAADGIKWATPASSGVTSIDVAVPAPLSSSGGPVTSTGTITLSWASGQTANRVLASPDGTTGAVSLRALVAGDIPGLPASQITSGQVAAARGGTGVDGSAAANGALLIGNGSGYALATLVAGSGVTITNGSGTVTIASSGGGSGTVTSVTLTVPGFLAVSGSPITTAGTLAVTLATQSAGTVFAGPASGAAAAPTFRALAASDLPPAAAAGGHIHAHGHFL